MKKRLEDKSIAVLIESMDMYALYREQFGDQTDKYREMSAELGRLQDIQGDIQAQRKKMATHPIE